MLRSWLFLSLACSTFGGCIFDTSYDLVSTGDERRELKAQSAPDHWYDTSFDDSAWTVTRAASDSMVSGSDGAMPTLYVRQRFTLGPDPGRWRTLTLRYTVDGSVTAYVNGRAMTKGDDNTFTIALAPGAMTGADNVLALAVHPRSATVPMSLTLDGNAGDATGHDVVKGPYLMDAHSDGVTVAWQTAQAVSSQLVVDGKSFDGGSGQWHFAKASGLAADHSYPYFVQTNGVAGESAQFATAPLPGRRVRFAVYGDNRTNGDVHAQIVQSLVNEAPDFLVNTGDMVGESTDSEWQTFFTLEYPLLRTTPFYPVMGNHEHDYGDDDTFHLQFPYSLSKGHDGSVYSFDYGSVHVAVLDSNDSLLDQALWLEQDLALADKAGQTSFVTMHFGPVCGCSATAHGSNDDASVITDTAARHHVAAILSGHNHLYERGVVKGVPYVVTGGGGAPLNGTGWVTGATQATFSRNHYVIVDVMGAGVHVSARDVSGASLDEADLPTR